MLAIPWWPLEHSPFVGDGGSSTSAADVAQELRPAAAARACTANAFNDTPFASAQLRSASRSVDAMRR
jgi:hypothetical protein